MNTLTVTKNTDVIHLRETVTLARAKKFVDANTKIFDENGKLLGVYLELDQHMTRRMRDRLTDPIGKNGMANTITLEMRESSLFKDWYNYIDYLYNLFAKEVDQPKTKDVYYIKNQTRKYHLDTTPAVNSFSTTLILRKDSTGGEIVLPQYDIAVAQKDSSVFMFNGRQVLHGTTKINHTDGYRICMVFMSN